MKMRRLTKSLGRKETNTRKQSNFSRLFLLMIITGVITVFTGTAVADVPFLVHDVYPGASGSDLYEYQQVGDILFFTAQDDTRGFELWMIDDPTAGAVLVKDINPNGDGWPESFVSFNGMLYFSADDGVHGGELWKSDGTEAGTVMVKDINASDSSWPYNMIVVDGELYFIADNGNNGYELWKSDGSGAGTEMVRDINSGADDSDPSYLTEANGMLYFQAYSSNSGVELWKSDGTEGGTVLVKDIRDGSSSSFPRYLTVVNNTLFFSAYSSFRGYELWKSDGTESGTVMVSDINRGIDNSSNPSYLTAVNNTLFFRADDGSSGYELWKSDGTVSATTRVRDIYSGSNGSFPSYLTVANNMLFFRANDGSSGNELWKSDGTEAGTFRVKDINSGTASSITTDNLTTVNGLLFFPANDGTNGEELWKSDGTEAGTGMVMDIFSGTGSSNPSNLSAVADTLYFRASDGSTGSEPWAVIPGNTPPLVPTITDQYGYNTDMISISFHPTDLENDSLSVTYSSSDQTLLPNGNIMADVDMEGNYFASLMPVSGQTGSTVVTVTISDGEFESSTTFTASWDFALVVPDQYPTISAAIFAVEDGSETIILIRDGIYTATEGNIDMILDSTKTVIIRSENGPENCIIDLQGLGRAFIFGNGSTATIDGLTIKNGNADKGGAITSPDLDVEPDATVSPTITNCIFENNRATIDGGAIFIRVVESATPAISNCSFSGNSSKSEGTLNDRFGGGAITVDLTDATTGFIEITDSSFLSNAANWGGAIRMFGFSTGNSASKISNSTFANNYGFTGGAVAIHNSGSVISACSFRQNKASWAGAVFTNGSTITNSIFLNNRAVGWGGAIGAYEYGFGGGPTTISFSTFYGNKANVTGGAIHTDMSLDLINSIAWGNNAVINGDQIYYAPLPGHAFNVYNSDIEGGIRATYNTNTRVAIVNSQNVIDQDPLFSLDEDFHLMPDSPCIDVGTDTIAGLPITDREGKFRSLDGNGDLSSIPDMGAYEYDRPQFPAAAVSPELFTFYARIDSAMPESQTLSIRSRGLGTLNWSTSEETDWLRVEDSTGTSADEIGAARLYVDHSALAHGIYSGTVNIVDSDFGIVYRSVEVTLYVTAEMHVPTSYPNIQSAIDAAIHGDEVIVADSEEPYTGEGNYDIDFRGKRITVRSANGPEHTIIDCENSSRGFIFTSGETSDSVLQGFTITGGDALFGGGIFVGVNASPTILGCNFINNTSETWGGGVFLLGHEILVSHCRFENNLAETGGGLSSFGSFNTVESSIFLQNVATGPYGNLNNAQGYGGGIHQWQGIYATLNNNIFKSNRAGRGGGIHLHEAAMASVSGSTFQENWAQGTLQDYQGSGGGLYIERIGALNFTAETMPSTSIYNCVFHANDAYWFGAGFFTNAPVETVNCTFAENTVGLPVPADALPNFGSNGAGIWAENGGQINVINSIFYRNRVCRFDCGGDAISGINSTFDVSYSNIDFDVEAGLEPNFPPNGYYITDDDPLFVNYESAYGDLEATDLRLQPESPVIDIGTDIPWLFSDIRGSIRPVDGEEQPRDGVAQFDLGAYEYSEYFGGLPGDQPAKAFSEFGISSNSSLVVTGFEYEIGWSDRDPFPQDPRIDQGEEYEVRLLLVNEYGLRIELATYTSTVTGQSYTIPITFGAEHIGTWQLRLELTSDPNQFVLSDTITIEYKEATRYALSQWVRPPDGADPELRPDMDDADSFFWSEQTKRLYAIAPTTSMITWWAEEERQTPFPVVAYVTYPNRQAYPADPAVQIHVADSQPVNLLPETTPFDLAQLMYAGNDATVAANFYNATTEGWSVIFYRDAQEVDPDLMERFDVVRTYVWNHKKNPDRTDHPLLNPDFPFTDSVDIGTEVTDSDHNLECSNGYIFFPDAYYDGYGDNRAHERTKRSGPIFIVNENNPELIEDDLVVVWYYKSEISQVCWPSKPVHYETPWPVDAPKIVIASQLGSGPLFPDIYGQPANMMVYNQPDPDELGYNPNEEHGDFFTAMDSAYPALYALRDDLNRTVWNFERRPFTSKPYSLLKYVDPIDGRWNFEVFEVVAQSSRYRLDGTVQEDNNGGSRYLLDENGDLNEWLIPLTELSYYIDGDGHLKNSSDAVEICYNFSGGIYTPFSGCLPSGDVKVHYFDGNGVLQQLADPQPVFEFNGLLTPGSLPEQGYFLNNFGILVKGDVFYRFHYPGVAGQEINPPYPLNQLTFGPCSESYFRAGDEEKVLKDKDNKFFAKHGGINDVPTVDLVLNYFYRLQSSYYYDLDANGYQDESIGTPIPWLDGLDGNFDGETPVSTTFAISWPDPVPTLFVGETLTDAKTQDGESVGLPNIMDQCVVHVLFDQSVAEHSGRSVKLIDPVVEYGVDLPLQDPQNELPEQLGPNYDLGTGRWRFAVLPYHIQSRLTYDPLAGDGGQLKLRGIYSTGTGESMLLLNSLTERDIMEIGRAFLPDPTGLDPLTFSTSIISTDFKNALYNLKSQGDDGLTGQTSLKFAEMKALTAGNAEGLRLGSNYSGDTGYHVTLAFNNDADDCPGPVSLSVIKVDAPLYRGEVKVIEPVDVFEEKVTLRHNGDFGGNSAGRWFQWRYLRADFPGIPYGPGTPGEDWRDYFEGVQNPGTLPDLLSNLDTDFPGEDDELFFAGALDVIVQGTGQQLLPDKWFSVRYHYDDIASQLSRWTRPQLYEGWVKRVMKNINLFDQKVKDFHISEVNTYASMISLAGRGYEGDIALNSDPDNLQKLGMIETYQTLLNRAKGLSIDQGYNQLDTNKAVLFAANRVADLYMLLGNEAYGDALDPTIGFSTEDGQFGSRASSLFCFENQVDTLLEEELTLLRGRADEGVRPHYNRNPWNFTLGDGEFVYVENYNINDQNEDGEINELDAMIQFPQGHGDAWGHYLSAIKSYYNLLTHPDFAWIPEAEAILVEQTPVLVDYRDERKFAIAAAAKARTGRELVNLTYRQHYVEDPEGQWQGYKDNDPVRSWGLDGWARRSGQGAFFDWVVGNAILPQAGSADVPVIESFSALGDQTEFVLQMIFYRPDVNYLDVYIDNVLQGYLTDYTLSEGPVVGDPSIYRTIVIVSQPMSGSETVRFELRRKIEGVQKVDRSTVLELAEVASQYRQIQAEIDRADVGLNPVGVAKGSVPFDISPAAVAEGQTHFEQIYGRAVEAMNNAVSVFNYANQSSNMLRRQDDSLDDFQRNIDDQEQGFTNRLIELYGYPYADDCGPGKTYSTEYCQSGPDLYHYMYVDPSIFMGYSAVKSHEFPVLFRGVEVAGDGQLSNFETQVMFHVDTDYRFGLIKPPEWLGKRKAPGELQIARSDLLQLRGRFEKAIADYNNLQAQIDDQVDLLQAQYDLNTEEIFLLNQTTDKQISLNNMIASSRGLQIALRTGGRLASIMANALAEFLPRSVGLATDATSAGRGAIRLAGTLANEIFSIAADIESLNELGHQMAKEIVSARNNIVLTALRGDFAVKQQLLQLENMVRSEATFRYELYNMVEAMRQSGGRYLSALAKGDRLMQERLRFRKQTAAQVQDYRYKDMSFRIFRNDALQKYRAQFDLAATYVYLAAKAYDYETTLLDGEIMAGQHFLTDIVRQRTIGMMDSGQPLTGSGLADAMKRMYMNFQVLKPQLGFNNPQIETNRFSLRQELFRITMDTASSSTWRQVLQQNRVDDLWDVPEFRRYCRPFAEEGLPQPGIVIPFSTTVTSGLNFFAWPLGGGDSYYSATNFATKVRSVGVWFSNYNSVGLAQTPRIYLVPVGEDILRTPSYSTKDIRTWRVIDQKLPLPFPIVNSELENNPGWIPSVDTIFDEMFEIRRHSDFRAYHDSGYLNESEIQYDSRLIGRSVWNSKWMLIIPGRSLLYDAEEGLDIFIEGPVIFGGTGERTGEGISDIKIFFETYGYSGN